MLKLPVLSSYLKPLKQLGKERGTSVSCICWEWEVGLYQPLNEVGRMESGGQGRKVIRNTVIKTFIAKDIVLLEVNFDLYNMFLSKSEL